MGNILKNGTVLPSGLLGDNNKAMIAGFNKSYRNFPLRIGVVIASYPISDPNNRYGLTNEYDVAVLEQNEDRGTTNIVYKNCMSSEGFGSIADFFERTLRPLKTKTTPGPSVDLNGQDGAIVLLLCMDAMSDKGIIISSLTHPDRVTNLTGTAPYLEGEYNGINIKVNTDGSAIFTFNGATDNQGQPVDSTQGQTVVQVEKDGSFQLNHSTITFRLDRNGTATLTTNKDLDLNVTGNVNMTVVGDIVAQCKNLNATASGDAIITASGTATIEGQTVKLGAQASESVIKGDTFKQYFDNHVHPTNGILPTFTGPPTPSMPPSSLSKKVQTE